MRSGKKNINTKTNKQINKLINTEDQHTFKNNYIRK